MHIVCFSLCLYFSDALLKTQIATSEGGSGGEQWSRDNQRGRTDRQTAQTGLVDQSYEGLDLKDEAQDMYQGSDENADEQYAKEQGKSRVFPKAIDADTLEDRQGQGLNPYSHDSIENLRDAGERLASGITDMRGRKYESGPAASDN